jgi:hypothetical protein
MSDAMTITVAKPPRSMKLNRTKAELVPVERLEAWHAPAIQTSRLTTLDRQVLDTIAD